MKKSKLHSCRICPFPCWHQPIFPPFSDMAHPCNVPFMQPESKCCAWGLSFAHYLSLFCCVRLPRQILTVVAVPTSISCALCMLLVPVQAESIIPPFDGSFVIVLYQEQIALLVCAFTLPGYWSYKLIKLIPVLFSVAVYILQPKLLSFNHSFPSISQPVLSPLQQLHLYNSQYPRNDLPEQPFPILPLVQTLFSSFLGYGQFFLCSEQKKRGSTKVLGMEIIRVGKREIILCITASFTLKGSTCVCWLWCNFPSRAPWSREATGRVSGDVMLLLLRG